MFSLNGHAIRVLASIGKGGNADDSAPKRPISCLDLPGMFLRAAQGQTGLAPGSRCCPLPPLLAPTSRLSGRSENKAAHMSDLWPGAHVHVLGASAVPAPCQRRAPRAASQALRPFRQEF